MSTKNKYAKREIGPKMPEMSRLRTIVETPFYGNNVKEVTSVAQAYELAKNAVGTVVTDMPIEQPETLGLPKDAKVLLFNDGAVTGRTAAARRIVGQEGVDTADLDKKAMEAVYQSRYKTMLHASVIVGLDEDFMVRAHLLIPESEANILYNWMLNFQPFTKSYQARYEASRPLEGEGDIYFFSDPTWSHPEHPMGLCYFDPAHNVACVLGMRYFGEHKKGTLTLGWAIANRNGYVSCHGGQKEITRDDDSKFVLSVFGLSGSGKSTITHATHAGKYGIQVLHDDAFVIQDTEKYSIAMEPTYFDKTQDYPADSPDNKYLLTVQNCGATLDDDGNVIIVPEDIRNGNGRAIKSRLWSPNRVDRIDAPTDAIMWIMKDPTLPPLVRIQGSALSSLMGATLATKRTSAERLAKGVDPNALVIEPYANPFRTWPLSEDFLKFKALFDNGVDCYILNTGEFMHKDIDKHTTLGVIESVVDKAVNWKPFGPIEGMEYADVPGYEPNFDDVDYKLSLKAAFERREGYVASLDAFNALPADAHGVFAAVADALK